MSSSNYCCSKYLFFCSRPTVELNNLLDASWTHPKRLMCGPSLVPWWKLLPNDHYKRFFWCMSEHHYLSKDDQLHTAYQTTKFVYHITMQFIDDAWFLLEDVLYAYTSTLKIRLICWPIQLFKQIKIRFKFILPVNVWP